MTARDPDGYLPISDYAVLGDGRTTALAGTGGRVDWWALPSMDSPPACAALLDLAAGSYFSLAPDGPFEAARRYLPGTNVMETTYTTPAGTARVTGSLNTGAAGRLPWAELARRVDGLTGDVPMHWEFLPGDRFAQVRPWVTGHGDIPVVTDGDQNIALIVHGAAPGRPACLGVAARPARPAGRARRARHRP
ncbi:MAG: trehalase-like domain-containing protein [Streptosporangiaceae bacterium]